MTEFFKHLFQDNRIKILGVALLFLIGVFGLSLFFANVDEVQANYNGAAVSATFNKNDAEVIIIKADTNLKALKESLSQVEDLQLRTNIESLIVRMEEHKSEGERIAAQFDKFDSLSANDQEKFLKDVVKFLDEDKRISKVNFGLVAKENELAQRDITIGALRNDIHALETVNGKLTDDNTKMRTELMKLREANVVVSSRIVELRSALSLLMKDSAANAVTIARLRTDHKKLEDERERTLEQLNSVSHIRVDRIVFKPFNTKARKDGTYKLSNLKEFIELSFQVNANLELDKSSDKVRIVVKAPNTRLMIYDETVKFGQTTYKKISRSEFEKKNPGYQFASGLYSVQFYSIQSSGDEVFMDQEVFDLKGFFY